MARWRSSSLASELNPRRTNNIISFRDLPPGDYLIAALTDMEPTDLGEASFRKQLAPAAVRLHLNEGEKKTQDVKLVR